MPWFLGKADTSGLALLTEGLWFSFSFPDSCSEPCSVWQIGRNSPSDFTQISASSPLLSFCQCILKMYLKPNFVGWQHDKMSFPAFLLNFRDFWQCSVQKNRRGNGTVWLRVSLNVPFMLEGELKWDILEEALTVLWMQLTFPASPRMQLMIRTVLDEELMIMGTASSQCICLSERQCCWHQSHSPGAFLRVSLEMSLLVVASPF